jgi:hypothetical protein
MVTGVTSTAITITPEEGAAVTVTANATTQIFLDGAVSTLGAIKTGDHARALYDSATMIAAIIEAESVSSELATIAGTVTGVASGTLTLQPDQGSPVTLVINATTKIFIDGTLSSLPAVQMGSQAQAAYDPATLIAAVVRVESPEHEQASVTGKVTAITAATITITPNQDGQDDGSAVTLKVDATTQITLDGTTASLTDLKVGDLARAVYDRTTMLAATIQAASPQPQLGVVTGNVTVVSATAITITPEEGSAVTLTTDASTKITLDGAPSTLAAIPVGAVARAVYNSGTMVAVFIEAESPHQQLAEVQGKVTAVTSSSITITPEEEGSPVTLASGPSTQVFLDGQMAKLTDIPVGAMAHALYDSATMIAVVIQAQSPEHQLAEVDGQVTAASASAVSIQSRDGGAAVTVMITSTTQVFLDGHVATAAAIPVGAEARALYDTSTMNAVVVEARSQHNGANGSRRTGK